MKLSSNQVLKDEFTLLYRQLPSLAFMQPVMSWVHFICLRTFIRYKTLLLPSTLQHKPRIKIWQLHQSHDLNDIPTTPGSALHAKQSSLLRLLSYQTPIWDPGERHVRSHVDFYPVILGDQEPECGSLNPKRVRYLCRCSESYTDSARAISHFVLFHLNLHCFAGDDMSRVNDCNPVVSKIHGMKIHSTAVASSLVQ